MPGFVATHTPDVHIWKPVFRDGELVCFVGSHIHNTDVGGAVPATLSRSLTEVHQEGMRIPPMRLMRDGVLNDDLLQIIVDERPAAGAELGRPQRADRLRQCRRAQGAGDHRPFRQGRHSRPGRRPSSIMPRTRPARSSATIPDGEYFFADYADEDQVGGYPVRIAVTLQDPRRHTDDRLYRQRPATGLVAEHADRRQ